MATIYGSSGESALNQYTKKMLRVFVLLLLCLVAAAFVTGYMVRAPGWLGFLALAVVGISMWRIFKLVDEKMREAFKYRKGAEGEMMVSDVLDALPDGYHVFHDATHASFGGNIDHLVIGPQGVFNVETKNWTGTVRLGPDGEVLLNDVPTDKPVAGILRKNSVALSEKIKAFTNASCFVQSVMVFPHAYIAVDQREQNALYVDMRTLDRLEEYLTASRPSRALTKDEVKTMVRYLAAMVSPQRA